MRLILSLVLVLYVNQSALATTLGKTGKIQEQVTISLNIIPTVRNAFYPIFAQFEEETGILVVPQFVNDFTFAQRMDSWSKKEITPPDIMFGHNGERLKALIEQDVVHSI